MSTEHTDEAPGAGLPVITRRDIDRFVLEGRRLRAREIDRLLRSAGFGIVTVSTPFPNVARTSSASAAKGSRSVRANVP